MTEDGMFIRKFKFGHSIALCASYDLYLINMICDSIYLQKPSVS